jgi:hypothetical protein
VPERGARQGARCAVRAAEEAHRPHQRHEAIVRINAGEAVAELPARSGSMAQPYIVYGHSQRSKHRHSAAEVSPPSAWRTANDQDAPQKLELDWAAFEMVIAPPQGQKDE